MPCPRPAVEPFPARCACTAVARRASRLPARTSPRTACPPFDSQQVASAFNQPLSFDTSSVTSIKVFPDLVPARLLASLDSTSAPSTRHTAIVRVPEKQLTAALLDAIQDDRLRVTKHVLYETLGGAQLQLSQLHTFMEHHVWAVYDYFQLLKRLQAHLTCVRVPWAPTADPAMRRFISEIVLEEECDVFEDGKTHGAHLELYIRGMEQAGANTLPIKNFLKRLAEAGAASSEAEVVAALEEATTEAALEAVGAPRAAARHVRSTLDLAQRGSIGEVAAVFAFGREDVVPAMFSQLLQGAGDAGVQHLPLLPGATHRAGRR